MRKRHKKKKRIPHLHSFIQIPGLNKQLSKAVWRYSLMGFRTLSRNDNMNDQKCDNIGVFSPQFTAKANTYIYPES